MRPWLEVSDNGHLRRTDVKLSVWSCGKCDVCYLNPFPPTELGAQYFADSYSAPAKSLYYDDEFKARVSRVRITALADRNPPGRRLLDVGCGKGQFVRVARQSGFDAWGVEFDRGAVATARQCGLETVLAGSLDHPSLPSEFHLVTLWDVIEHLQDPSGVLGQVFERLAPGGLVAIRTANIRSAAFARNPHGWWAFGVDHRFYFSPRSLSVLLTETGFRGVEILNLELIERPDKRRLSLFENPRHLVRHLLGSAKYGGHYWTSLMTVIARRPSN